MAVNTLGHLLAPHVTPACDDERSQVGRMAEAIQAMIDESVDIAFVDQDDTGQRAAVRLVPIKAVTDRKSRRARLETVRASTAAKAAVGPSAARSQDFLYGDDGLPK